MGWWAHTIDEAIETLQGKLGFPLSQRTPLPDGAYFAPEGTHNYFFEIGAGETQIEVLIPVVPEAGTYKYLQRFGPGLHHWGYACDDVAAVSSTAAGERPAAYRLGCADPAARMPQPRSSIRKGPAAFLPSWCRCARAKSPPHLRSGQSAHSLATGAFFSRFCHRPALAKLCHTHGSHRIKAKVSQSAHARISTL